MFPRGRITEFTSLEEFCDSPILIPGFSALSRPLLGVIYFLTLCWLFLGINTISDVFMAAIEVITSSKRVVSKIDAYSGEVKQVAVPVWNPTVANLTLMALGSSAPEIFLSVIETVNTLGSTPGELGPSTIVGSAAFNFLVITAVSILAVTEDTDDRTQKEMEEDATPKGIKKINDVVVFAITATWSVVAYLWLFKVLMDKKVETWEGVLTFCFFWILLIMAYVADCCRAKKTSQNQDDKFGDGLVDYGVVDFYEKLIPLEQGKHPETKEEEEMT
jgi:solute carrier family 8 (sodium/calcium exchanger)